MRVPTPEIVEYHEYRTLSEAFGQGAQLATEATWKDWAKAVGIGAIVGAWLYLVVAFRAGALF